MAINAKLEMRQTQSLVMTPQLQQAIKLLQLSNMELSAFVEGELERNPLLERSDGDGPASPTTDDNAPEGSDEKNESATDARDSDNWVDLESGGDNNRTEDLDADPRDMFPDSEDFVPGAVMDSGWSGLTQSGPGVSEDGADLEAYVAEEKTLRLHLSEQLALAFADPAQRMIGQHIIDLTDESGYLRGELDLLASQLGAPLDLVEDTLRQMQDFDPCGVFARDLRECLSLQLKEQDRCDPAMAALIDNLHLLAAHDLVALKRATSVSDEDLVDMIAEVRRLNPKPGLEFGVTPAQPIVPDVLLRTLPDGSYHVELNSDTLPRVLVNQTYYARVSKSPLAKDDKSYLVDCLQTANWLVKSLDQRARTILKVSQEIVRQQDAFFTYGVRHLRPLNLKTVADAISMHESTVSRVTANKYMATNRGLFELKYFFTSAIAATGEGDFHSSEAVRHRIREMIDGEPAEDVLSDDKIVERLKVDGIDIARRTVAKYREALGIPSSVQRRRQKRMALTVSA
ncbi:RNA polymerase sigma-54 factor [Methyloceanibacter stevinii]|uniref:RNA polymerase sigma-54 factor n=1 Tax=Methyloceanibacter stevinii TaxID=1774970 RepID=A0A1E3VQ47_9HYPH|nr:RNA polymerase factor sigma-54 [Methyloceanibacter stevinii]ODR95647.1 RNA polymerase sigma-54 factor [Methyloceanibacter stevinii]